VAIEHPVEGEVCVDEGAAALSHEPSGAGVVEHPHEPLGEARDVVAGKVYYDLFLRRAEQLGVGHAVRTLGAVPKDAIPHLLAAADLEAHEQGDGLGTATLEAMASGVYR